MLPLTRQNVFRQQYREAHPGWRPATELFADIVRQHLRDTSRLLDLGCGRGGLLEQLDHPLSLAAGIDPDLPSLITHRLPLARAVALSDDIPFANASFDLIFASWLLEHLARPRCTFEAMARVLKPGGSFIFITPNARHPLSLLNRGLGRFARLQARLVRIAYERTETDTFPTYYRANSPTTLRSIGQEYGLELVRLEFVRDPTYLAFTPALLRLMAWIEERLPESRSLHLVGMFSRQPSSADGQIGHPPKKTRQQDGDSPVTG
jgi:SAM-dependent methyltransferase